jgi:argininosuccinate lyase
LRFRKERLEEGAGAGFATATELADTLVRTTGMPFRTAHRIVGRLAQQPGSPTLKDLDDAAYEIAGYRASQRGLTAEVLASALDPHANVALRNRPGGPSPSETERMLAERQRRLEEYSSELGRRKGQVEEAIRRLREM